MNFSNYRLSLDIHETESGLSLRAKKGDTIRKIYVTLMDGGVPYRITSDCTAAFTARKPDNTILFNDAVIENNAIVYELSPQTTSAAGQVRCEVRLYGGDGRLITSPRFFLDVDDTVFTEGDQVVSEDEYTILEDAIGRIDQAVADFQARAEAGEFTDVVSNSFLSKSGGTMSGDLDMGGHKITNLAAPTQNTQAATKAYVDTAIDGTKTTAVCATLTAAGWAGDTAPYTQTLQVSGLTDAKWALVYPVYGNDNTANLALKEACGMVSFAARSGSAMTFTCLEDKPEADIPVTVEVYV